MSVPEVKLEDQWCPHAKPGHGCKIYNDRPDKCRDFVCGWLFDEQYPDYWYPARAKIVINPHLNASGRFVGFVVDPSYPNRWREEPWYGDIRKIAMAGLKEGWKTYIVLKGQHTLVRL